MTYPIPLSAGALLGGCIIGAISAFLAYKRQKNPYLWFAIGFFFGIFGIMAIFFAPRSIRKKESPVPAAPLPIIHGPTDKLWYYLDTAQAQQGPMSHHALTTAWREGKIDLSTYLWNEELTEWKPLGEFVKN